MPIKSTTLNLHSMRAEDQDGRRIRTSAPSYGEDLKRIILVTDEIIRTKQPLCRVTRAMGREFPDYTPLGKRFAEALKIPLQELEWHFPNHDFSPLYIVFKRATRRARYEAPHQTIECYQEAVRRIRRFARSTALQRRLESMKRGERATRARMRDLCRHLRQERSRVMVLRIDLGFHVLFAQGDSMVVPPISLSEVQAYLLQMKQWLDRGRMSKHILAHISKLEWGVDKGYHIHLAVLMDGHEVRADSIIGDIIGRAWVDEITEKKGMYWNCNRDKQRYARCALGTLHRSDEEQWQWLEEETLGYLTKSDFFMRLQVPAKTKTFGIGGLHAAKLRAKSKQIPPVRFF